MLEGVVKNDLGHENKTVMDIVINKAITEVLDSNHGNRLTPATVYGLSAQITQVLCRELRVNEIPADFLQHVADLEKQVDDLGTLLETATEPTTEVVVNG